MCERTTLNEAVEMAWQAYDNAAGLGTRVNPAIPVLFFGDLDAYRASALRVLTVGLNPSLHEFPATIPFSRFPLAEDAMRGDCHHYLNALSSYFRTDPYRSWFSSYESPLNGAGASYYAGGSSTALHTDICSPVATNPTWTRLRQIDRDTLETYGRPLWHILLKSLKPHLVVLSIAKPHLELIEFQPMDQEWRIIHTFRRTKTGAPRSRPYEVLARWYDIGGEKSLLVFGEAAQTPFGSISDPQEGGGWEYDARGMLERTIDVGRNTIGYRGIPRKGGGFAARPFACPRW